MTVSNNFIKKGPNVDDNMDQVKNQSEGEGTPSVEDPNVRGNGNNGKRKRPKFDNEKLNGAEPNLNESKYIFETSKIRNEKVGFYRIYIANIFYRMLKVYPENMKSFTEPFRARVPSSFLIL